MIIYIYIYIYIIYIYKYIYIYVYIYNIYIDRSILVSRNIDLFSGNTKTKNNSKAKKKYIQKCELYDFLKEH